MGTTPAPLPLSPRKQLHHRHYVAGFAIDFQSGHHAVVALANVKHEPIIADADDSPAFRKAMDHAVPIASRESAAIELAAQA
jgi:hypothetical protein